MGKKKKSNNKYEQTEFWIDAHCHLCNEPLSESYSEQTALAEDEGIGLFISTALNRREIDWHLEKTLPSVKLVAGIHPFYDKSSVNDFDYLRECCESGLVWGIGEVGYDNRKNNHNYQRNILYQQLELAQEFNLPVVFHVVRRFNELYQALKDDFPQIRGYIHGFNGSAELVEMFSKLNVAFSIGYKLFQKREATRVVNSIVKRGLFLLESDAPFQANPFSQRNLLSGVIDIAEAISSNTDFTLDDVLDRQWETFHSLNG